MRNQARTIMLQGTASDVGKSVLAAAFCRIFVQDGYRTAPFKSQNMSLNSYVTPDGFEIGRAQGMQADACGIAANTDMNPILLKPVQDMASQVVVHGKPYKNMDARTYREQYLDEAKNIVIGALTRLRSQFERVVIEGAGSPAEINLKDRDIVNMNVAKWADAPVILVADIDRGGVFASIVGTMEILTPEERDRVKGFIINKFRGDVSLLQSGLEWLEEKTGKPVLGVVPYMSSLDLEDEDSASLDNKLQHQSSIDHRVAEQMEKLDIAVIRLPRMANFTDFDALKSEKDVHLRYIEHVEEWGKPDAVILPGTKNTMDDLTYLYASGLAPFIKNHVQQKGVLVGICGGYQMMGERICDPYGVEGTPSHCTGLGFFPMETVLSKQKITERVQGMARLSADAFTIPIQGYEIHMGKTRFFGERIVHPFRLTATRLKDQLFSYEEGIISEDGRLWGTYVHGIFQNDNFRRHWLNELRRLKGWQMLSQTVPFEKKREEAFDRWADHVRMHVKMDLVEKIINE